MNILHINIADNIGGASIACVRLHKSLLSYGLNSRLLVLNQYDKTIPHSFNFRDVYYSSLGRRIKLYIDQKRSAKKQMQLLKNTVNFSDPVTFPFSPFDITLHPQYKKADIIHFHWTGNFLDYSSFFRKNNKPVVWTIHDKAPFTAGVHCTTGFPEESYEHFLHYNKNLIIKSLENKKISFVSPSNQYKELASGSDLLSSQNHYKIYHGIDSKIFKPINKNLATEFWNLPSDKPIIMFAASEKNRPLKGLDLLLEALSALPNEYQLCVIGEGFDIKNKSYINLGLIKDERLMALAYNAADVFVSPSLEESFGLSLVESVCCGTPVVCFNVGVASEIIQQNINGCVCSNFSSQSLLKGIQGILNGNYTKMDVSNSVKDILSEEKCTNQYIKLYKEKIESGI